MLSSPRFVEFIKPSFAPKTNPFLVESSIDDYQMKKTLGQGAFGKVRLGVHKLTCQKVAIKIIHKNKLISQDLIKNYQREINILKRVDHPNIVKLYEIIETKEDYFIIMEYMKQDLMSYIIEADKICEQEAAELFSQMLSAISYLHSMNICHRDIKPTNILISRQNGQRTIKLTDFGLSRSYADHQHLKTCCGSPCYIPPEMILGDKYDPELLDVWSLGVTLYVMLAGYLPFDDEVTDKMYKKVINFQYNCPPNISKSARILFSKIFVKEHKRIEIKEIINHSWLKSVATDVQNQRKNKYQHHQLAVELIQQLGVSEKTLLYNLQFIKFNKITTAYELYKVKAIQQLKRLVKYSTYKSDTCQKTRAGSTRRVIRRTTSQRDRNISSKSKLMKFKRNEPSSKIELEVSKQKYTKMSTLLQNNTRSDLKLIKMRGPQHSKQIYAMENTFRAKREMSSVFVKSSNVNIEDMQSYYGPFSLGAVSRLPPTKIRFLILKSLKHQNITSTESITWKIECQDNSNKFKIMINHLNDIKDTYIIRFTGLGSQQLYNSILANVIN